MTGDGYALLLQAGAQLVNMEFTKFFPLASPRCATRPSAPGRSFYDTEGLSVVNGRSEDLYQKLSSRKTSNADRVGS